LRAVPIALALLLTVAVPAPLATSSSLDQRSGGYRERTLKFGGLDRAAGHAARRRARRPDLMILSGSVGVLHGRVSGSFQVINAGSRAAPRSTARVTFHARRHNQVMHSYTVRGLKPGHKQTVEVRAPVPASLGTGSHQIVACADAGNTFKERSETNNCLTIGSVQVGGSPPSTAPPPSAPVPPIGGSSPPTTPGAPIAYTANTPQDVTEAQGDYWVDVPPSYDSSNRTPETLLVWMHGCGGDAQGDTYEVAPGDDRSYIAISVGGRDGGCWDPNSDAPKVLAAVADVKTHFNINPRRVIIAGYSSGGDLAYRTIFDNAALFAGIVAENTSPFRDTGSTQSQSLAAASWKFNVVHLAHTEDDTYPVDGVTSEVNAMKDAGFPVTFIAVAGHHYDPDDAATGTGTDNDLRRYLLPHVNDGWLAP
jgi:CARDB protein